MSVADDLVEPRLLQVPKWASATTSGQRSAAQNGQDSSLTKTIAGLPLMVRGGLGAATFCSGVAAWPELTRVRTLSGTAVACRTTTDAARDSLAEGCPVARLIPTSAPTTARTATTAAPESRSRLRISATLSAARSAAIRSRARAWALDLRADAADLPPAVPRRVLDIRYSLSSRRHRGGRRDIGATPAFGRERCDVQATSAAAIGPSTAERAGSPCSLSI